MSLTTAQAQISVQDGTGAVTNVSANGVLQYTPGALVTFALQNTSGVVRWALKFESLAYPSLNGLIREALVGSGQANQIQVQMPAYPSPTAGNPYNGIVIVSEISDLTNGIASAQYTAQALGSSGVPLQRYADLTMNAALAAYTNVNGVITANGNGVMASVDGVVPVVGMKILLNGLVATAADAGLYQVTSIGTAGTPFVLTRDPGWANGAVMTPGTVCEVNQGTAWANSSWKVTNTGTITVGTTDPKLLPRTQKGTGATGAGTTIAITTLFAAGAAPLSVLVANDLTANASVQVGAIVGSTAGVGTCTLTGTTANTINWVLLNW